MNHDERNSHLQPEVGSELEARIVAWVAGEASAFEVAELQRLIGERPELAFFKRRIEAVQGLVAEAVRPDKTPLRLSPERRASLLQTIGVAETSEGAAPAGAHKVPRLAATWRQQARERRWILAVAACALVGLFFVFQLTPSFQLTSSYRSPSDRERERQLSAHDRDGSLAVNLPIVAPSEPGSVDFALSTVSGSGEAPPPPSFVDVTRLSPAGVAKAISPVPQAPAFASTVNGPAMEPFEVTATRDQGYQATETLAGTRVRRDLKDVPSSVSVVTQKFLEDIGATNSKDLLSYSGETETAGSGGNFLADADKETGTRVRGLDWAEKTGDFGQATTGFYAGTGGRAKHAQVADSTRFGVGGSADNKGRSSPSLSEESEVRQLSPFIVATSENQESRAVDIPVDSGLKKQVNEVALAGRVTTKSEAPAVGYEREDEKQTKPAARPQLSEDFSTETSAAQEPVSTFSLHVSDVSFRLAQAALARGEMPDPALIRPEEFYNAFDYGDPAPAPAEKIACRIEQVAHPLMQQRNLVRIAMRVPATGRGAGQPLRLTVLLDTSGSMEREDRAAAVRGATTVLASLLGPNDRITLIGFARQPRLLAEQLAGDQAGQLPGVIARIPAEGGTNFEEALKLGGELARRHFEPHAQNRIVLLTDGAANLGNADPAQLARMVETLRQQGIAFDACGVGTDGIDDTMLEALTRKGDGRYCVLDTPDSADAGFARQLAGAFRPAAKNVKVQVRFNPARVDHYRLIGFEHHRLRTEDFRNDQVDAAELAAEEAAVALYQVEVRPQGEGELGEVYVRFRDAATGNMVERSWTIAFDPQALPFDRATPTMKLAGTAALLAEKLRGGPLADRIKLDELAPAVNALRGRYEHETRVRELVTMFEQVRRLGGK